VNITDLLKLLTGVQAVVRTVSVIADELINMAAAVGFRPAQRLAFRRAETRAAELRKRLKTLAPQSAKKR
jgi:hypothetical protein